ncbi:LytR C-terminal domain-containing protein [Streptomyces sp. TG1A-8]|uniref:LytR C-terminal domain-containing protein n=1 Tax=Streptomyces sp. TG1A-8 TaxID=3051385 RepID=UPI00265C7C00|nr:LytR C-terminal domain-containing protein [Streptomyces sp. TG1A-8]MDO0926980.1 LytR C-terminal domain-containing protein [Streptomyces sp. TG1A-8]
MSMLTPPGMGGKYRIRGDKYPRMRPRRKRGRLALAAVASVAALGLIGWGTLQLVDVFTGGGDRTPATGTTADCRPRTSTAVHTVALPEPAGITVNVYNATRRSGLAKTTADELRKRGFRIGDVGNAAEEFDKKVKGAGILLGPASALNTSLPVLATQLAGAERRTEAGRKGTDLDLIIGDGFRTLTARPAADRALTELSAPDPAADAPKKACPRERTG